MKKKAHFRFRTAEALSAEDQGRIEAVRAYMGKTEATFFAKANRTTTVTSTPTGILAGPLRRARPRKAV
jgi:hypothetical protein